MVIHKHRQMDECVTNKQCECYLELGMTNKILRQSGVLIENLLMSPCTCTSHCVTVNVMQR